MTTYSEPPLKALRVEKFRGFRDPREFLLARSSVIVTGPNGTGKTSFFDALQWCLLGKLERLEVVRAKKTVEHIVNQYRLGEKAEVEIDLSVSNRDITIRRTGDHNGSTLEFREAGASSLFGDSAEAALSALLAPSPDFTLELALNTSGLMQQDVMRAVLEARPAERYAHLSTLLGLSQLESFESAVKDLAKEAANRASVAKVDRDSARIDLEKSKAQLDAAEQRVLGQPQAEAIYAEVVGLTSNRADGISIKLPAASDIDASIAAEVARNLGGVGDLLVRIDDLGRRLEIEGAGLSPSEPTAEEAHTADAAVAALEAELARADASLSQTRSSLAIAQAAADDLARLAAAALPLLTHACPVCGQAIDPAHVEQELNRRSGETETIVGLQSALSTGLSKRQETLDLLAKAKGSAADVARGRAAWANFREISNLRDLAHSEVDAHEPTIAITRKARSSSEGAAVLASVRRRLLDYVAAIEDSSAQVAVERFRSEVSSHAGNLKSAEQRLVTESQRAKSFKLLSDSTVTARVEVTERRFNAVQPLVDNIFHRLDPHPAFKTMRFELDTFYKKGTTSPLVHDPIENVSADPLLVFSTSQANIAALSYFLAMGLATRDARLPFVLLDDPVQSMDDVNVLGFADLCRHLRLERQLIISTHERRLSRLLERKLTPRVEGDSTRVIAFVGWDRSGPIVEERDIGSEDLQRSIRIVDRAG